MPKQFAIWKQLYHELELHKYVRHHAIGGLVGLRKTTGISFAPFTGISFFILDKYLRSDFAGEKFRPHYLGVYSKRDRFHIAFLHKLFQTYLKEIAPVEMTYDSINPIHTVRMNAAVPLYHLADNGLEIYPSLLDVPEQVLMDIATGTDHAQDILIEIERRRSGERLENSTAFGPLNVYSNLQLDRLFEWVVDEFELIGEVTKATSPTNLNGRLRRVFKAIQKKYPAVFTAPMLKSAFISFEHVWMWHRWFIGKRDAANLEMYMQQAIQGISFPDDLKN